MKCLQNVRETRNFKSDDRVTFAKRSRNTKFQLKNLNLNYQKLIITGKLAVFIEKKHKFYRRVPDDVLNQITL